jgi:hypothetical protein
MNDRDLASAYQRGVQGEQAGHCPDPDTLRKVIEGQTTESTRLEVISHVMACQGCRHEFDLLDALHQAGSPPTAVRATPKWVVPLAVAAVALLVGVTLWSPWAGPDQPVLRGGGATVDLVTGQEAFQAGTVQLMWRSIPDAVQYELRVMNPDGTFVASRQLADTTTTFEGDWAAEPGAYEWRVSARRPDGTAVSSAVGSFRIE